MKLQGQRKRVMDFIGWYIETNSQAPTLAEIGARFQMKSPATTYQMLVGLEREGFIRRTPNISRGIEIVEHPINPS